MWVNAITKNSLNVLTFQGGHKPASTPSPPKYNSIIYINNNHLKLNSYV